jgi:hypothetical protein
MKQLVLFSFVIFIISCNNSSKLKYPEVPKEEVLNNTPERFFVQYLPEHWKDTFFNDGSYLKMKAVASTVIIKWGNKKFENVAPDSIIESVRIERLSINWKNDNFIALSYGCGNPCWGGLILPLDKNAIANSFMYQYDYDQKNNLVARFDDDYETLIVENLKTHAKQLIMKRDSTCESAFAGFCLDSISLKNKVLYYKWSTPDAFADNKKSKEYHIKIDL